MKKLDDLELRHHLNEALNNCLDKMKVKVKEGTSYDICLEQEYDMLLCLFSEHLKSIVKTNKKY